jgi:adenylate cyclase
MLAPLHRPNAPAVPDPGPGRLPRWLRAAADRYPFVLLFLVILGSNLVGSFFNSAYNTDLILKRCMDERQRAAFWNVAFPLYNAVVYPIGIGLTIWLLAPLARCRRRLRAGQPVPPGHLELCRRRLVNLPFYQVCINFMGWLPGAVAFPLLVCWVGGDHNAGLIWVQFVLSFLVSALLTTAQTFFLLETYLIRSFYPDFFQDARPAQVRGVIRIPFALRLLLLWSAVAVPLLALLLVAMNFSSEGDVAELKSLALAVTVVGIGSGGLIFWLVGYDVSSWVMAHAAATEQVESDNLDVQIAQRRPDEWGLLTDRFNDMVAALARARQVRETFGQFVSPKVRDDILQNYHGLGGEVQPVTVLFADIRGFTRRSAGQDPARVVEVLNQFLTLAVTAIEESSGGWVDKFLGDGVMALFGVRSRRTDHADQALAAARELLARLQTFNEDLVRRGEAPLQIGVGIHTGPALVGCIGATVALADGRERVRREFTAVGETVNLAQRLEQLTKTCGGPVLLSEQTYQQLHSAPPLKALGSVVVPGYGGTLVVYCLEGA